VTDICPLTSSELADSLYKKIEESEILIKTKKSYLTILNQIKGYIQKDQTNNALKKIETLLVKIQKDIDNGKIENQTGIGLITILNILKNNLSMVV